MITPGPFTAYSQQCHILNIRGNQNPNPREEIINNLIEFINNLKQSGHQIILSIDANEEIKENQQKNYGIQKLLKQTQLIDAHKTILNE